MPDMLCKVVFTESELDLVADFECGDEEWEKPLAEWIKSPPATGNGALYEMARRKGKLQVWLHANQAGELDGYSSLGESNWEWPTAEDRRVPINVIPYVAIHKKFWGCPKADPPRYAAQILDDLIAEARKQTGRQPLLGLFVDPRNTRAIRAYKKAYFEEYFRRFTEGDIEYVSMLLKLARPAA
jgi:ribosomal protein S18 acetylase RimI-like enzyme